MKLSLIIATYNRGPAVERLLWRLSQQSLPLQDWEVIVVDDGSSDDTSQRLKLFETSAICNMRFLTQVNTGAAVARHRGILTAQGQRVVVNDDDMELSTDFLAAHARAAEGDPEMTVVLGDIRPTSDWLRKPLFDVVGEYRLAEQHKKFAAGRAKPSAVDLVTGNISYPRSLYLDVGGFDLRLRLWEDLELGLRLGRAGAKLVFSTQAWTVHQSNIGDFERWKVRQIRHADAAVQIWRANKYSFAQHPMKNLLLGNFWKRWVVLTICRSETLAESAVNRLARIGDWFQRWGMIRPGIAAYQLIESLGYQLGLKRTLGSWDEVRNLVRGFREQDHHPP